MEEFEKNQTKDTFINQQKEEINEASDKMLNLTAGNFFIKWWGFLGVGYLITYQIITPLLKSTFLIATWTSIIMFYGIIFFIAFVISKLFNALMKLLLYISKS